MKKRRAVLDMFEQFVGPEKFRAGVNAYLKAHASANATAADFWAALSQATGRTSPRRWQLPSINRACRSSMQILPGGKAKLTQRRFTNAGGQRARAAVESAGGLKVSDGKTVQRKTLCSRHGGKDGGVCAGRHRGLALPNADGSGYYRFSLDRAHLLRWPRRLARSCRRGAIALIGDLSSCSMPGFCTVTTTWRRSPTSPTIRCRSGGLAAKTAWCGRYLSPMLKPATPSTSAAPWRRPSAALACPPKAGRRRA